MNRKLRRRKRKRTAAAATRAQQPAADITSVGPELPPGVPEPVPVSSPEPPEPMRQAFEADQIITPDPEPLEDPEDELSAMIDTLEDGDMLVELKCGEYEGFVTYGPLTVVDAMEDAAAAYVTQLQGRPEFPIWCTVHTPEATFGPTEVKVELTITVPAFENV